VRPRPRKADAFRGPYARRRSAPADPSLPQGVRCARGRRRRTPSGVFTRGGDLPLQIPSLRKNSASRVRFRPPPRRTFGFRLRPTGVGSTYSRPVLAAGRNLRAIRAAVNRLRNEKPQFAIFSFWGTPIWYPRLLIEVGRRPSRPPKANAFRDRGGDCATNNSASRWRFRPLPRLTVRLPPIRLPVEPRPNSAPCSLQGGI